MSRREPDPIISPNTGLMMFPMPKEEIEDGWYELRLGAFISSASSNPTHMCHLRKTGSYVNDGVNKSYFMTVPHPDSTCGNGGQYVWRRSFDNYWRGMAYLRPLLPFEIIELKFKMYGWCKMSKESFFNRDYLSGRREFVRK